MHIAASDAKDDGTRDDLTSVTSRVHSPHDTAWVWAGSWIVSIFHSMTSAKRTGC